MNTEKKFKYKLLDVEYKNHDRFYHGYGITVVNIENGCTVDRIENICLSKLKMRKLIALCNNKKLDPTHLNDVVDDFINNDYE